MNVKLSASQKVKIANASDIYPIMQQILLRENKLRRAQEHFWVVGLNNNNTILFIELISLGATNRVSVDPPEIFRIAIYKLATKVIFVHNHPSGNTNISDLDKNLTKRLMVVGQLLEIAVIDHLIISETEFRSFQTEGVMKELDKSRWIIEKNLEGEVQKIKLEKLKLENTIAIANKMKLKGIDIETISEITGLEPDDIR